MSLPHFYLDEPGASPTRVRRPSRCASRPTTRSTRACCGSRRASTWPWWTRRATTSNARSWPSTTTCPSCASRSASSDEPDRPMVVLVQGLAKGDKMDTVIRHATELGVSAFVPLACERSIVKLDDKKAAARRPSAGAPSRRAPPCSRGSRRDARGDATPARLRGACALLARRTAVLVCWEEAPGASRASTRRSSARSCSCRGVPQNARVGRGGGARGRPDRARGGGAARPATPARRSCRSARPSCAPRRPASWHPRSCCTSSTVSRDGRARDELRRGQPGLQGEPRGVGRRRRAPRRPRRRDPRGGRRPHRGEHMHRHRRGREEDPQGRAPRPARERPRPRRGHRLRRRHRRAHSTRAWTRAYPWWGRPSWRSCGKGRTAPSWRTCAIPPCAAGAARRSCRHSCRARRRGRSPRRGARIAKRGTCIFPPPYRPGLSAAGWA